MKRRPQLESLESRSLLTTVASTLPVTAPVKTGEMRVLQASRPIVSLGPVAGDVLTARALSASGRFSGLHRNHNETLVRGRRCRHRTA